MSEEKTKSKDEVQLVVFSVGTEEYGLEVSQVQEIIRLLPITRVPRAAAFIEGVINLRGNVIPVVNLHYRLGLEQRKDTDQTRIIITEVQGISVGLIVDQVLEVLYLSRSALEPPASAGSVNDAAFIKGIGKLHERLILLLDLESLLYLNEAEAVS